MSTARRNWWRWVVALGLGLAVAAGVVWLRRRALLPQLPTATATRGDFLVTVSLRASLAPLRSVDVDAPDVAGLHITWLAPRGSVVQAGQPIARFDSSTARQSADAKTAALRQAQATLEQAQATARITDQQDALDLATDQAGVQSAALDASKAAIVSPIEGAESNLTLGMAQEKLKVEQATIAAHQASSAAKIASAQRLRDKAQADLDEVNQQLKQMELSAPLTGVVNYLTNYSQGYLNAQAFKVGDSAWPSATIAEIPDLSSIELLAKISEVDRGRVAVGEALRMHLDALPELTLTGKITALSALAESDFGSGWPPPRVFRMIGRLDHLDARLRPDMNGSVDVITRRIANAISVPAEAVFTANGKPVVYAARGDQFVQVAVTVLARNPDAAAVTGVAVGTKVALQAPLEAAR